MIAADAIDYQGMEMCYLIAAYNGISFSPCYLWLHNRKQATSFILIFCHITRGYISVSGEMGRMLTYHELAYKLDSNILRQPFSIYKFCSSDFASSNVNL